MYRTIDAKFWTDPKVRSMTTENKLLLLYLITNSHSHVSGIYYLPTPTVLFELGIKEIGYRKGIDTLSKSGMTCFDPQNSIIWVKNMLKYQGNYDKIWRSTGKHLSSLHKSFLIKEFLGLYPQVQQYFKDTLSIGYPGQEQDGAPRFNIEQDIEIDIYGDENTPKPQTQKFQKPTIEEIKTYCQERANRVDPEKFFAFYESKGWYVGKNKMKCWKSAVHTWEKNDTPQAGGNGVGKSTLADQRAAARERFLKGGEHAPT